MVGQKNCREQQCSEVNAPKKDVDLKPGGIQSCYEHDHGENESENLAPRGFTELGYEEGGVEVGAVNDREPHVKEEKAKVAMISMTNAITNKHAMMFPLQNANVAYIAVPRSEKSNVKLR